MIVNRFKAKFEGYLDRKFNEDIFFRKNLNKLNKDKLYNKNQNYWSEVADEILDAAQPQNQSTFFQNKAVLDHLASDYASLNGYDIISKIKNHPRGEEVLNICTTPPWGSPRLLRKYPFLTPATASHIANILSINDSFGIAIEDYKSFVDFGGGYGGLSRCLLQLNNKINLTIIDLEQMIKVQKIFLDKTLKLKPTINFVTEVNQLDNDYEIFNACFSFSETPLELRENIDTFITDKFKKLHIIFQNKFNDIDNLEYMKNFSSRLKNKGWSVNLRNYEWHHSKSKFLFTANK
jgi:hypothetical protein